MDRLPAADYTSASGSVEADQANADAALKRQRRWREERHPGPDPQLLPQHPPPRRRPSPVLLPGLHHKTFP
ncbi:hypothetical protein V496_10171, partial [Pseudogymnoascus sp. VKM F-4515 (FW-2607)]